MTVQQDVSTPVVVRRHGRRTYQAGAAGCLVAAVPGAVVGSVVAGAWWVWPAVPVVLAAAVLLFVKSMPFEHVRFGGAA